MAIRYRIKDTDTVEHLASEYLGDPERWREIVEYNKLVYPYISRTTDDRYQVYAKGFVKVVRSTATQEITIHKYWTVKTKRNVMSSVSKTYHVVNDVTMAVGQKETLLYVRSVVPGLQGNVATGSITELGNDFARNSISVSVVNEAPIAGGTEGFIRTTGEYIFIPSEEDVQQLEDFGTTFSYEEVNFFYGEDLAMEFDDLLPNQHGDLATVNYIENIKQSINRRFTTERGDMLSDFSFGNGISEIIGDNSLPIEAQLALIRLEVLEALNEEDRITEPEVTRVEIIPGTTSCAIDITMTIVKLGSDLSFNNLLLGGNK